MKIDHDMASAADEVRTLWKNNRLRCGWFMRDDFIPETRDELLRCLELLMMRGDRETYIAARKLVKCL
jgi:hypothetical protein